MKILLYVLLAFGVFCFFSCKRTEKEQLTFLMKEWTRKEILFHDRAVFTIQGKDTLDKFPYASTYYKIVTYVDSLGCLSCKLQLLERINFIAEVDSVTSRNVSFYFFFHLRNRKELIMTLQSEDFIYPVCIDLKDTFNKLNKFPLNDKFRTFLLDNTNKGEFYQFNLSSCIRQQNSLTAQFVSFSLANLANIFYPPPIFTIINLCLL